MDWIKLIQESIDEIEDKLYEDIDSDKIAESRYISSYYLQKMFSTFCNCTISEYIRNRRLTLAGTDVVSSDDNILDIALKYRYDSADGFTKAFTRFHGVTPMLARKNKTRLNYFAQISIMDKLTGGKMMLNNIGQRGYIVKETGAVYHTEDMNRTLNRFVDVLGWYGQIDVSDENNNGLYGCVNNIPIEVEALRIAPFTGIHLFKGTSEQRMVAFMMVQGIEQLYSYVKSKGWNEISEVIAEPWGSKSCTVTTIDGCILKFFE